MKTINEMTRELAVLQVALNVHETLIDAAYEARDAAREFCKVPVKFGLYVYDSKDYPAVAAAEEALNALREDDGYIWASSHARDLKSALEGSWCGQLSLFTYAAFNPPHPCVARFIQNGTANLGREETGIFFETLRFVA